MKLNFNKIKVKGETFYQEAHRPYQSPEKQALALLWLYNHFGKSHYYLSLENGITLHLNTQGCIMLSLFEICQVVLENLDIAFSLCGYNLPL